MNKIIVTIVTILILGLFTGCISHNNITSSAIDSNNKTDKISFGMVKKYIKVGITTQEEVIKLFGSADNIIMQGKKEIWIYDRFKIETKSSSSSDFKYGTLILIGGSSKNNNSSSTTSIETLTVIIDFTNNIVTDLNIRKGGY